MRVMQSTDCRCNCSWDMSVIQHTQSHSKTGPLLGQNQTNPPHLVKQQRLHKGCSSRLHSHSQNSFVLNTKIFSVQMEIELSTD